nr:uncharacterized protein LOC117279754 [Nicotiana tomentosiformis]
MTDHMQEKDYELWVIITNGPLPTLKKNVEGEDVPKTRGDYNAKDLKKWENNAKTKKWLVCGLGPDEYRRIQGCSTTKKIWDTLIISEEKRVKKILNRVLPVTWERKIIVIQESKNIATLPLDELIGSLKDYELMRQIMNMDVPKKDRSLHSKSLNVLI